MPTARAFVFDFYATLATDRVSVPPMWQVLNDLGYRSHPELEAMFEPDAFDGTLTPRLDEKPDHDEWLRGNWREFVRLSGVAPDDVNDVLGLLLDVRDQYRARPIPGARQLLSLLRGHGLRVGLCSNWESPIEPFLEQAGLSGFDAVVTSAMVGARKPHPAIFAAVADRLDVAPREVVFVGDNWSADVAGAVRSGMVPVWIRNGRSPMGLTDLVTEFDSIDQLHCELTALLGAQTRALHLSEPQPLT